MKLTKEEIVELKKVHKQIKVLNEVIEELGQNLHDSLALDPDHESYLWDCLYGNSSIESFIKYYNKLIMENPIYKK